MSNEPPSSLHYLVPSTQGVNKIVNTPKTIKLHKKKDAKQDTKHKQQAECKR